MQEATPDVAVVVPSIREQCIRDFLFAWGGELSGARIIVVEDNPTRTFDIKGDNIEHYSWEDIDEELGSEAWIIPRRTDCVRSFGYLKALESAPDMIVTLDDDCYPQIGPFLEEHWIRLGGEGLGARAPSTQAWVSTLDGVVPRGVPYEQQQRSLPCLVNHGLWSGVIDYDAPTQLLQRRCPSDFANKDFTVPLGSYFPMCGMNLAFRPDAVPAMYFMLMGGEYTYDRFGDIWAGILVKRIADHLRWCVRSGGPSIRHMRASSVWANLVKEAPGLEVNERFWRAVDNVVLTGESVADCYRELAIKLDELSSDYWIKTRKAMVLWADLAEERLRVSYQGAA